MEIRINNSVIDAHLENEKNALDVIQQVDEWLSREGYFIASVLVNGKASSPSETTVLNSLSIEEIDNLDIQALPINEVNFDRFSTLLQYFTYFRHALKEKDPSLIKDLHQELPYIINSIDTILDLRVGNQPVSAVLDTLFKDLTVDENGVRYPAPLYDTIVNLCIYIEGRLREIANPLLELQSTARLLKDQIPNLEEIPVLLQTGKEREAMSLVIEFTEISEKITRLLPFLQQKNENIFNELEVEGSTFADFYRSLNENFSELAEAIEAEDSILIGDLLEYEISQKITSLVASIEGLPASAGNGT